jgi:hypothetical protein
MSADWEDMGEEDMDAEEWDYPAEGTTRGIKMKEKPVCFGLFSCCTPSPKGAVMSDDVDEEDEEYEDGEDEDEE